MVQYQHYIPQFLLRNFSHPYQPPKGYGPKKKNHRGLEMGKNKGDKVLNVVDLTLDEPQLIEAPVSRWFGQEDLSMVADHRALHIVRKAHDIACCISNNCS
jgi:hypothetical protein